MRSTLVASLSGTSESKRELLVRDDRAILEPIFDALTRAIAQGEVPKTVLDLASQGTGKRRRGVDDAPPSAISDEDRDLITVHDEERLYDLVFTEPKVVGRKGRPPRNYRVPAEQWGPAFRLMELMYPEVVAEWAPARPWWIEREESADEDAAFDKTDRVDARSLKAANGSHS